MNKKINSALISVYYKDGLDAIVKLLNALGVTIYSTGGTEKYITELGIPSIAVETLTSYPSILGGRVKTLHPSIFGGILGKRDNVSDLAEMKAFNIPEIDLVIVDLYPFEETVRTTSDEKLIIEKIDIGGPSMIRAAAKNHQDIVVIASKRDYPVLQTILEQGGETSLDQRKLLAAKAFDVCTGYDIAISNYFAGTTFRNPYQDNRTVLRYGENPHQAATFYGNLSEQFDQLNGKELSYNNIVDVDAALQLIGEFAHPGVLINQTDSVFAIIKHTNVCGIAARPKIRDAWDAALAGDPESAFGGVLITNTVVDNAIAESIHELFFEVLIAPSFETDALEILKKKKNRILLKDLKPLSPTSQSRSILNGTLVQQSDIGNYSEWNEVGGRASTTIEKKDMIFANIICKHLKSNAIAIVKNMQLIGKGCGQTSRIDALRQAIEKSRQFNFDLTNAVLSSDAFFPFDDCVKIAHEAGITAFIQPGGSIRDKDSIDYCKEHELVMVITAMRHFKH